MAATKESASALVLVPDQEVSPDESRCDTGNQEPVESALNKVHKETFETKPDYEPAMRGRRYRKWIQCTHCVRWFAGEGPRKYCSRKCCDLHAVATGKFKDANNPRWLGGVSNDNMRYRRRQRAKEPLQELARHKVYNAIRSGKLVRQACEKCGGPNAHGHHDDYSKPLEVRWLCRTHHDEHHREIELMRKALP